MAYDIGTARGVIEMEYNGRGVDQAQDDIQGLEKSGAKTDASVKKLGRTAGIAGLAIAGGLALAVNAAANFEQRMSAVEAVSGATEKQMGALSDKALQLGADTSFSATEAASAIEELVKAGISVPDVLNGAADAVVSLAAAGEIALPDAAAIAANSMNQFNLTAQDMVATVDTIAGAANTSAIDVGEFGQSLQQVGAVANLAGVSFDDTATAIAIMGNAGIKGSDAGTSLKTMLQNLQPTTKKQIELAKELGIVTENGNNKFFTAQGELKSLSAVSGILQNSTKNLTKQQRSLALETLFGTDAIRAAAVLSNEGSKGFDKMGKSMGKVSAADVAAKRLDNFKGSIEQMKGSLETAGIAVGTALIPPLNTLVGYLTQAANWFNGLSSAQQGWIAGVAAGVAALLLIVGAVIKFIMLAKELRIALLVLRGTFIATWLAALGPIALVIAAIALIVIAIIILWKKSETFRNIVTAVWEAIKSAALAVASWFAGPFVDFFVSAWDAITSAFTAAIGFITGLWDTIVSGITAAWSAIGAAISAGWQFVVAVFQTYIAFVMSIWSAFWGTFGGLISAYFGLVVAVIKLYWVLIKGIFLTQLNGILAIVRAVWTFIKTVIQIALAIITAIVRNQINAIRAVMTAVWNAIRAVTSAVWNGIRAVIAAVWGAIGGTVRSGVNAVRSAVSAAWNTIKSITSSIWNAVRETISSRIDAIMDLVSGIQGRIVGFFAGAATWLVNAGREVIQGLINGVTEKLGELEGLAKKAAGLLSKVLPGSPVKEGPLKVLNNGYAGKQIIQMVIDGIDKMTGPLSSAMDSAVGAGVAVPVSNAMPTGLVPRPRGKRGVGGTGRARLLEGTLRLDPSGKAFITGVAMDADDDADDYSDTLERMGRR